MRIRYDSWANTLTPLGSARDKSTGVYFAGRRRLDRRTRVALFGQNALCYRECARLAFDSLREGWTLAKHDLPDGYDVDALMNRIQTELQVDAVLEQASVWSRLHGAALIVLSAVDGRRPSEPLDENGARFVFRPTVVAADDATPLTFDSAFGSPTYRQYLSYQIQTLGPHNPLIEVHHSRVIKLEPVDLPLEDRLADLSGTGFGPPVIERVFAAAGRSNAAQQHTSAMMYAASILYLKVNGLKAVLDKVGGKEEARKIFEEMASTLTSLGLMGLDSADEMGLVQNTMTGIEQLLTFFRSAQADTSDLPREILLNESPPAGLNNGELSGPQAIWFAFCAAYQKQELTPILRRILGLAFKVWGVPITSFDIKWNPLWVRSDETAAETSLKNAQSDAIYMDKQVIDPDEVRRHRFVEGRLDPLEVEERPVSDNVVAVVDETDPGVAESVDPLPADALDIRKAAAAYDWPTATLTAAIKAGELRYWGRGKRRSVSMADVAALARGHEVAE